MPGQRTVVKHSYLSSKDKGFARARAHVNYVQFRPGKDQEKDDRTFFNGLRDDIYNNEVRDAISEQDPRRTIMHKLILSPGVQGSDVKEYAREVMADLCSKKGLDLEWYAVEHHNTQNPHCHIVVMGTDEKGRVVRLYKSDYDNIKEAGDRYLERNSLLDREKRELERDEKDKQDKERREHDERSPISGFFDALKDVARAFSHAISPEKKEKLETDFQKRRREKQEEREAERNALGEDLSYDSKLFILQKSEERQQAEKERAWKEYCKPVQVDYHMPDGSVCTFEYDRTNSLDSLRELAKDYQDNKPVARNSLSETDYKRVENWIDEKEKETKNIELEAEKLPEIYMSLDSQNSQNWSKESPLEDLRQLVHMNARREVYLDPVEEKALQNWIYAQELKEPILVDLERSEQVVSYQRDDSREVLSVLLEEHERGDAILTEKEAERLKTWIDEKDPDRTADSPEPEKEISVSNDPENRQYKYSRDSELPQLKELDESYRAGDGGISEKEYKLLKVWIADKEHENADLARQKAEQHWLEIVKEKERQELEKPISVCQPDKNQHYKYDRNSELSDLKSLAESHEQRETALSEMQAGKLKTWIADKEREEYERPIEYQVADRNLDPLEKTKQALDSALKPELDRADDKDNNRESEREREKQSVSRQDKLEKLKELDKAYSPGTVEGRPTLKKEDHEKLKQWITHKEKNEIEYGDKTYTKETPLDQLQKFRQDLTESRHDKWIEKDKFSRLSGWIREKEAKEIAQVEKEADRPGKKRELDKDRKGELEDREAAKDGIRYGKQLYSKETSLSDLQKFRRELAEARYDKRIEKDDYKKLCNWIKAKEERGDHAFTTSKSKNKDRDFAERTTSQRKDSRGDRDDYLPKYRPTPLEKRIQWAVKQEKAERQKAYYTEKTLQKERLEKEKLVAARKAEWMTLTAKHTVLIFVHLLHQGAVKALDKIREYELHREVDKLRHQAQDKPKEPEPLQPGKDDKKDEKKVELVLPYPDPRNQQQELANKAAIEQAEPDRLRALQEKAERKPEEKPDDKPQDQPEEKPEQKTKDDLEQPQKPLEDLEPPVKPPDHIEPEPREIERPPDLDTPLDLHKPPDIPDPERPPELLPPEKPPLPLELQIELEEAEELNRAFLAAQELAAQRAREAYQRRMLEEAEEEERKRLELERLERERTKGEQPEDEYGDE